jgi:hypothetical protein
LTCQKWEAAADQFENWEYVLWKYAPD